MSKSRILFFIFSKIFKVKLIDRVLLMGEIVRPLDNLKKIGFISNVSISCDVMLLPFGQFVLKNVTNPRINFVQVGKIFRTGMAFGCEFF